MQRVVVRLNGKPITPDKVALLTELVRLVAMTLQPSRRMRLDGRESASKGAK